LFLTARKAGNARGDGWRALLPATRERFLGNDVLRGPFPGCTRIGHGSCASSIASPPKTQQQTGVTNRWANLDDLNVLESGDW